eukprot:CAMPEP_0113500194 /NCGR_PEP_ID=MMETSP0014_2-20120614/32173_1 /TAXON_ID=2857 /ORGANISM="Nitzschia sp." /LENGTH=181 /DNA_ID=CAMNT_0000394463 /DNA_START=607 /DNA_END=1152 /DNA_ORIENTATION=- /assembly_acc=CAM_ASM_000159
MNKEKQGFLSTVLTVAVIIFVVSPSTAEGFSITSSFAHYASTTTAITNTIIVGAKHRRTSMPVSTSKRCLERLLSPSFMTLQMSGTEEDGVVELADTSSDDDDAAGAESTETEEPTAAVAPFLSQGEISEEAMEMDWKDPKQARVMFYIILSLIPVLFLIPLMLGSREMIPADMLPPVEIN